MKTPGYKAIGILPNLMTMLVSYLPHNRNPKSWITKSVWFLVNTSTKRNKRKHQPASKIYRLKQIYQKSVGFAPPKWHIIQELVWGNSTIHNACNADGKLSGYFRFLAHRTSDVHISPILANLNSCERNGGRSPKMGRKYPVPAGEIWYFSAS